MWGNNRQILRIVFIVVFILYHFGHIDHEYDFIALGLLLFLVVHIFIRIEYHGLFLLDFFLEH